MFMLIPFTFGLQMLASLEPYFRYGDGASCSTWNLSSTAWDIISPSGELMSLQEICIGHSTNNIVEYSAVFELFSDAISHGIYCVVIIVDSELMVLRLANVYLVICLTTLCMFLRVWLLERHFDFIQYEYISRNLSTLTNALTNNVLDRNLQLM